MRTHADLKDTCFVLHSLPLMPDIYIADISLLYLQLLLVA